MADTAIPIGPTQLTTSAATVYTAGASGGILRSIHVQNASGSDVTFTLSIGTDAAAKRMWDATTIRANGGTLDWSSNHPIAAGTVVQAKASANSALVITGGAIDL